MLRHAQHWSALLGCLLVMLLPATALGDYYLLYVNDAYFPVGTQYATAGYADRADNHMRATQIAPPNYPVGVYQRRPDGSEYPGTRTTALNSVRWRPAGAPYYYTRSFCFVPQPHGNYNGTCETLTRS